MTQFKTIIKKVTPDYYKIKFINDGHITEVVLEKSQIREVIETLDNEII